MTFLESAEIPRPVIVAGVPVLEHGSPAIWFTFPGRWHDVGCFHRPDGAFTGFYVNILTPVRLDGDDWHTTDLFLDIFVTPAGDVHVLDRDELDAAERAGWVSAAVARRARSEADRLAGAALAGTWPPPVVRRWTLERARQAAGTPPAPPV